MTSWTTRLAPSPTGAIHLGNARTFGLTWWWARALKAEIVLRIEDIDSPRKKPGAITELREDLSWLGLDWDRETAIQSTRATRHETLLRGLIASGAVYPCICSRSDVEEAQSAPHEAPGDLVYPGTCRDRFATVDAALTGRDRPVALRFRVGAGVLRFEDLVHGACAIDLVAQSGDFVVGRVTPGGMIEPGYQIAVVIDDADDRVTRVIRGDDLLVSAARQRLLQRALGFDSVTYAHLPLVVGADGRRLAKRHGDTRLSTLRERGVTPSQVWRWIAATVGRPFTTPPNLVASGFNPRWVPRDTVTPPAQFEPVAQK